MESSKRKILTLCIVHQGEKILLGMKKRGAEGSYSANLIVYWR